MNKLDIISNLNGLMKGYGQYKGYSQFGLSKMSSRYFHNNLDYSSSTHEMKIKFKRSLNNIYGYYNTKRYMRIETHSNCRSISDCDSNGSRFFRRK